MSENNEQLETEIVQVRETDIYTIQDAQLTPRFISACKQYGYDNLDLKKKSKLEVVQHIKDKDPLGTQVTQELIDQIGDHLEERRKLKINQIYAARDRIKQQSKSEKYFLSRSQVQLNSSIPNSSILGLERDWQNFQNDKKLEQIKFSKILFEEQKINAMIKRDQEKSQIDENKKQFTMFKQQEDKIQRVQSQANFEIIHKKNRDELLNSEQNKIVSYEQKQQKIRQKEQIRDEFYNEMQKQKEAENNLKMTKIQTQHIQLMKQLEERQNQLVQNGEKRERRLDLLLDWRENSKMIVSSQNQKEQQVIQKRLDDLGKVQMKDIVKYEEKQQSVEQRQNWLIEFREFQKSQKEQDENERKNKNLKNLTNQTIQYEFKTKMLNQKLISMDNRLTLLSEAKDMELNYKQQNRRTIEDRVHQNLNMNQMDHERQLNEIQIKLIKQDQRIQLMNMQRNWENKEQFKQMIINDIDRQDNISAQERIRSIKIETIEQKQQAREQRKRQESIEREKLIKYSQQMKLDHQKEQQLILNRTKEERKKLNESQ